MDLLDDSLALKKSKKTVEKAPEDPPTKKAVPTKKPPVYPSESESDSDVDPEDRPLVSIV